MSTIEAESKATASPDYVRTSLAAAMVLGLAPGRFYRDVRLHCINLLLTYPDGCRANCAYCGLARARPGSYDDKSFIRVDWPTLSTDLVVERMARYRSDVKRICLSMVTHPYAYQDSLEVIRRIRERVDAPISALIAPNLFDRARLEELHALDVSNIGIGLDAAGERVFGRTRGRGIGGPLSWSQYWDVVEAARAIYGPYRVNCHLVVGIGETDREITDIIFRLKERQVAAYLFCFYPEADSSMARRQRPPLVRYRRVQLAKHLIEHNGLQPGQIRYNSKERIVALDAPPDVLERAIAGGIPFMTDGCPGEDGLLACTRPFGSYRPGEPFRDYPFRPEPDDTARIRKELRLPDLGQA
ncbi:MAG: radical SAM protein [Chloroflexi bacterium]|nr:radical SAM protein [Chloroflexota bacterium]